MKVSSLKGYQPRFRFAPILGALALTSSFSAMAETVDLTQFARGDVQESVEFDFDTKQFIVDGQVAMVLNIPVGLLENATLDGLANFVDCGYFNVKKWDESNFIVEISGLLRGGGKGTREFASAYANDFQDSNDPRGCMVGVDASINTGAVAGGSAAYGASKIVIHPGARAAITGGGALWGGAQAGKAAYASLPACRVPRAEDYKR